MTRGAVVDRPSLEGLVETGLLPLESLHPGGLDTTKQLAERCGIRRGAAVLDVACGTGETACFLSRRFGARVVGADLSEQMIGRAREKAETLGLEVGFECADAADLPFDDAEFDAAICECTLCFLDKPRVLREMTRVVRSGGAVGIHDLCWKEGAPDSLKRSLADLEGERPETIEGWRRQFEEAGLVRVTVLDKSDLMSRWVRESKRQLGWIGQLDLVRKIIARWGFRGLRAVFRSERVFSNDHLGYGIVVGTRE
jgi:ubiquinone/menaquinone biosynthesis C-methylase UbiE